MHVLNRSPTLSATAAEGVGWQCVACLLCTGVGLAAEKSSSSDCMAWSEELAVAAVLKKA